MVHILNKTKDKELKIFYKDIRLYYKKTLKVLDKEDIYVLSLILVDSKKIQEINRDYRHIDKVTDVISFALLDNDDGTVFEDENIELGDIFINIDRVYSQAKDYDHSIKREFIFLFVHGLLHLLGYDHIKKEDEEVMFALQKKIVEDLK